MPRVCKCRRVELTAAARKDLGKLPIEVLGRIHEAVTRLQRFPDVTNLKPLKGALKGSYRMRVGDYRMQFHVGDDVVTVTRIGNRKDVYD